MTDLGSGAQAADGGLRLQVMGPLRVWRGDAELDPGPRQQRVLLALLLAEYRRPIGMADVVDLLWEAEPPATAVNIVQKYVGALRRLLEPDLPARSAGSYLMRQGAGYRLAAGPDVLDLAAFRRLVVMAGDAPAVEAVGLYSKALRLCHGSAGVGLADSPAAAAVFAGVDREFFDAAVTAAELAVRTGRPGEVLAPLRLAAQMGRLHERVHAGLMAALVAAGHRAEALAVFASVRERLADELGIDPGDELREAHLHALAQSTAPRAEDPETAEPPEPPEPAVSPVRPAQLPPDLAVFAGRRTELNLLGELVSKMAANGQTGPLVVAIDGMGGVGKSTLAAHFAHRVAVGFPDGQLYLDLQGHESDTGGTPAIEALRSLLYALGVRGTDVPESLDASVGTYRSLTAGRRILVLLDNVLDAKQVRPLLPNSADSLVLVTSRVPQLGLAASDGARLIHVDLPDLPTARDLLGRRLEQATRRTTTGDARVVDTIIESCGRLPLALAIVAARLSAWPRLSLESVDAELRDGARRLEALAAGPGVRDPRTAFAWSYRQLSPEAARLFRLLSVAMPTGITAEACTSLSGREARKAREHLRELEHAALITEGEHGHYTSHVLVKAYADELLSSEPTEERTAAVSRLLHHYLSSAENAQAKTMTLYRATGPLLPAPTGVDPERPASYDEAIDWFGRHREVVFEAVRVAGDVGEFVVAWRLVLAVTTYLEWAGRVRDWDDIVHAALCLVREHGDVVGEAQLARSLAGARFFAGAYEETLALLEAALRVFSEAGMYAEQLAVHVNFSWVHAELERYDLVVEDSRKAAALGRLAGDRETELRGLREEGNAHYYQQEYDEAISVYERALVLCEDINQRTAALDFRWAIAENLIALGRAAEAVEILTSVRRTSDELSQKTARFTTRTSLVKALTAVGDNAGARRMLDEATAVLESFQGGGSASRWAELKQLAATLRTA